MREIKFRAFHKPLSIMVLPDKLESINFETKVIGVYAPIEDKGFHKLRLSDFELMQYTGLKDRHKKEIYEGDIIKGTSYLYGYALNNGKQFDYFGEVVWGDQPDCGLCWLVDDGSGGWELKQTVHRNAIEYCTGEIIGNIYENPDLLKSLTEGLQND